MNAAPPRRRQGVHAPARRVRGVSLLGIDSSSAGDAYRGRVWQRLANDLRPRHLLEMTRSVEFDDLPSVFEGFINGSVRGRTVVNLPQSGIPGNC